MGRDQCPLAMLDDPEVQIVYNPVRLRSFLPSWLGNVDDLPIFLSSYPTAYTMNGQ